MYGLWFKSGWRRKSGSGLAAVTDTTVGEFGCGLLALANVELPTCVGLTQEGSGFTGLHGCHRGQSGFIGLTEERQLHGGTPKENGLGWTGWELFKGREGMSRFALGLTTPEFDLSQDSLPFLGGAGKAELVARFINGLLAA
jgi:hypothetical protein